MLSSGFEKVSQFRAAFGAGQRESVAESKANSDQCTPKSKIIVREEGVSAQHECRWRVNLLYKETK